MNQVEYDKKKFYSDDYGQLYLKRPSDLKDKSKDKVSHKSDCKNSK